MKKAIALVLVFLSLSAYAQFGDLIKNLEKAAKELEGGLKQQPEQPSNKSQQQNQPQEAQPQAAQPQVAQTQAAPQPQSSTSPASENEKIADGLLDVATSLWFTQKTEKLSHKQFDFNAKYGAPPISANHKKMVNTDIPNMIKEFSNCSIKKANRPINEAIIQKNFNTSVKERIHELRILDDTMKAMGIDENTPVKVPLKKNLNDAPDAEMQLRAQLNQIDKLFKISSNKNWCNDIKL